MLDVLYIVLFSVLINWMISLSILFQVSSDTKIKIRYTKPATRISDDINNNIASSAFSAIIVNVQLAF